jgi:hypothetical protein
MSIINRQNQLDNPYFFPFLSFCMNRIQEYEKYHFEMQDIGDVDPAYPMLIYLSDRYDLNMEQRYWLAFLYSTNYCGPTSFFMINDFPDFETVGVSRLQKWWETNKPKCLFQTDRKYVKLRDQFVRCFTSYRDLIGSKSQEERFRSLIGMDPVETYNNCYKYFIDIYGFGRYSMFLYLESIHAVTGFDMHPRWLDLQNSRSSCNGLCYAIGKEKYYRDKESLLPESAINELNKDLDDLAKYVQKTRPYPEHRDNTLCLQEVASSQEIFRLLC